MPSNLNTQTVPITFKTLGGGLNTASGPLGVQDNEASDLQNIEFDKFGSILERNGYVTLNSVPCTSSGMAQGLYWYTGLYGRYPIMVNQGKIYKMDDLDGIWDDITGEVSFIPNALDSYTKLLLEFEGANQSSTIYDTASGEKTVTNTETHDANTVLMLHCDGTDTSTTFTDSSLGTHTVTAVNNAQIRTGSSTAGTFYYKVGTGGGQLLDTSDSYNVLLMHCDGVDGIKTFTDYSPSMHTITVTGNAQVDDAVSKFGGGSMLIQNLAPPSTYVSVDDTADWDLGTGNWTIDYWVMWNSAIAGNDPMMEMGNGGTNGLLIYNDGANLKFMINGTAYDFGAWAPTADTWYHLAFVRNGNSLLCFKDGSQFGSTQDITGVSIVCASGITIGYSSSSGSYFDDGWFDEIRISKGLARWTANFTAPTKAFMGDYLTVPDSAAWNLSTSDYTIETFALFNSFPPTGSESTLVAQFDQVPSQANFKLSILTTGTNQHFNYSMSRDGITLTTTSISMGALNTGTWYHFGVCNSSSVITLTKDGTQLTTNTSTTTLFSSTALLTLGADLNNGLPRNFIDGYLDEIRISRSARWSGSFNPPTTPYGKVYITSSPKKIGSGSGEFKKYERVSLADSADFFLSTSNFTIDFWTRFNTLTPEQTFLGQYESDVKYWYLKKQANASGNKLQLQFINTTTKSDYTMASNWAVSAGDWHHIGILRSGVNATLYIDGIDTTLVSTTAFGTNDVGDISAPLIVGQQNNTSFFDGWLDQLRISKGIARYSGNFTPGSEGYATYLRQDFDTYLNYVLGTDKENNPWCWTESNSTASAMTVTSGITASRFVKKFQNYCVLGNVKVSGISRSSRVYWSAIKSITTWNAADYIDVSPDDGDDITGMKVLGDRLVVYKNNAIYVLIFTGDADIPFVVQKTNSSVGCSAPYSIQEVDNGHVFCSYDGVYYFDGSNSYKLSDRINDTFDTINKADLDNIVSMYQKTKNRYWLSCAENGSTSNNFVLTWNSFLNAWSKYSGMSASSMATFLIGGTEERPYFADYKGYCYRADYGLNDSPLNTTTAIDAYYQTNWKSYEDVCDVKGVPHVYIVHKNESSTNLEFSYSYDFYNGDQYTSTFPLFTTQTVTSLTTRRDLTGRGRFVRLKFANNSQSTSFRIDGLGTYVTRESKS